MKGHVLVCFACNDPDTGLDTGRFGNVSIGDEALGEETEIEGRETRIRFLDVRRGGLQKTLQVGRHRYPARSFCSWVGNWCWDGAWMPADAVKRLLLDLQAKGFEFTVGPPETLSAARRRGRGLDVSKEERLRAVSHNTARNLRSLP